MRILLIHNKYKFYGGEDKAVEMQNELLRKNGHFVKVLIKNNSKIENYNLSKKVKLYYKAFNNKILLSKLYCIVSEFQPDIVHIHNVFPLISPAIYKILYDKKVPVIQTMHNYRFMCPNGLFYTRNNICMKCLKNDNYYYCFFNRCYRKSYIQSFWYSSILARSNSKGYFSYISRFIVFNNFMKDVMVEKGFNEKKINVIPNFIKPIIESHNHDKEDYLLYMGRLSEEKGLMTLLESMKRLSNHCGIVLKIAGEGPYKSIISNFIIKNQLDNVQIVGFQKSEIKEKLLYNAKSLICPSECYETFGMTIGEAFAHGTMVICSNIDGVKNLVKHKINGLLFEVKDVNDLCEKIMYVYNNPQDVINMSNNAYKSYKDNYTEEIFYIRLMELYTEVISRKNDLFC